MPPSLRLHNLARLRLALHLTQVDLAKLADCSVATIRAVETGKLPLSHKLASRISEKLEIFDTDWLLKNDLDAPLPPVLESPILPEIMYTGVLVELFSRLCAVVAKMKKGRDRLVLELSLARELEALKKSRIPKPDGKPARIASGDNIKFLIQHPDDFDPDLREIINLPGLFKSNELLQPEYAGVTVDWLLPEAKNASPKHPKSPNRTRASLSPGDQHKKPKSS